jgi:hypothetical protein
MFVEQNDAVYSKDISHSFITPMAKKPTHIAYYVQEQKGSVSTSSEKSKGHWTKIGAAWLHKDGKGLDILLDLIPAGQPRLVLREWEEKSKLED